MKLAMSNIAWSVEDDAAVAEVLARQGVQAVEVAPTKIWATPLEATAADVSAYRRSWESRGMRIVAAQALLFGRPELTIFGDEATRNKTLAYLDGIIGLCADLGAEALVFGSPKNRRREGLAADEVERIAVEFFTALAESAAKCNTTVVLEANPEDYGADFVTHAADAVALVNKINHPGLRLHLDTACMTLANDPVEELVIAGAEWLHHFHISEPFLAPVGQGAPDHARFAQSLRRIGYDRWCSLEMKKVEPFDLNDIEAAIQAAKTHYALPQARLNS